MNATRKYISNLEIGDYVIAGHDLFKITKVTASRYTAEPYADLIANRFHVVIKINRRNGKVIGSDRYASPLNDQTPDEYLARKAAALAEKRAAEKARRDAYDAKLSAVIAANAGMQIKPLFEELQSVEFVDSQGRRNLLTFSVVPDSIMDYDTWETKPAVRLENVAAYSYSWGDDKRRLSNPGSSSACPTVENAIVRLIADCYWN